MAAWLAGAAALGAQDSTASLRTQFSHETNAVHKAKLMQHLGEAELQGILGAFKAGRLEDAEKDLSEYVGQVQECSKALDDAHINADKHPDGFKQLQISVREALRRLEPVIARLDPSEQVPFAFWRKQLDDVDEHLFHQLFPRGPNGNAPPSAPKKQGP